MLLLHVVVFLFGLVAAGFSPFPQGLNRFLSVSVSFEKTTVRMIEDIEEGERGGGGEGLILRGTARLDGRWGEEWKGSCRAHGE